MERLITTFSNGLRLVFNDETEKYSLTDGFYKDDILFYDRMMKQLWACDCIFGYNAETLGQDVMLYINSIAVHRINNL